MARRGGLWHPTVISLILEREGHRKRFTKAPSVPRICDMGRAAEHARTLRAQGLSLREIGRRLRKEGLIPPRGGEWHAASVADLLTLRTKADPVSAAQRARELRNAGHSLRQIAAMLVQEGHSPRSGDRFYPATISTLLGSNIG